MNSENLIFEALAIDDTATTSTSLGGVGKNTRVSEIYIKNSVISLVSIKHHNPETTVGLVINIDLDKRWKDILDKHDVIVWKCPYDKFVVPKHFVYSLSYYKLCAFDFILLNTSFKRICFIDCDTFCVRSFDDIWEEVEYALNIIPNESPYNAKVRKEIIDLYRRLSSDKNAIITHNSSGFIAGTRDDITAVINLCYDVYYKIIHFENFDPVGGDEIVWSLALAVYEGRIHSPRAYCLLSFISSTNYWIDKEFWDDPYVFMWHLPADKRYSLVWAFDYMEKTGNIPTIKQMASASRFRHVRPKFSYLAIKAILKDSSAIRRNVKKLFGINHNKVNN